MMLWALLQHLLGSMAADMVEGRFEGGVECTCI